MRILHVIPYFNWSYGGPVKVVYDISNELARRGHDVTIYTTNVGMGKKLYKSEKLSCKNIKVQYFNNLSNWVANNLKLHISPSMRLAIKKEIRRFDVIHLHEFRGIPNLYIWRYATKYKIPYMIQAHGAAPAVIGNQSIGRTISKFVFDAIMGSKIIHDASALIALTKSEAKQYIQHGINEEKIHIIPNGIDLDDLNNIPERGRFRKKYSISNNEKVILFLGRIHKIKGLDLLVKAFFEVRKEIDNCTLVVIGPDDGYLGQLQNHIKSLQITKNVIITGPIYGRKKFEAYMDADVFVLPSRYEAFPVTVLEACACGVPVIVTSECSVSDIIDKKVGYAVNENVDELRNAIVHILSNGDEVKRFAHEGRKLVNSFFNITTICNRLESLYSELSQKSIYQS